MNKYVLSENIAPHYYKAFNDWTSPEIITYGGRGCQKSFMNARKIALQLYNDKEFSVVVIRQVHNTHKDSTFSELCNALDDFGIKYRKTINPLKIQVGDNLVYFRGLDDVEKLKGFKPLTTPIKCIWFFEVTEFADAYSITQAKSSLARGNKGKNPYFQSIYEFNPPPFKTHWVYNWVSKKQITNGVVYFNTLFDIPEDKRWKWLGESMKIEVDSLRQIDEELYKHIYLGLPARVTGMIYQKFDTTKHVVDEIDMSDVASINIGVDWGMSDATVFTATGITRDGMVKVFKQYYHKNGTMGKDKDINEYVSDLLGFLRELRSESRLTINVYLDSANLAQYQLIEGAVARSGLRVNIYKTNKLGRVGELKGYSAIEERIVVTNILIGNNKLQVHKDCTHLIQAFDTVEYDKHGVRRDDGTFDIDSLDSFEYSILKELPYLYRRVLGGMIE